VLQRPGLHLVTHNGDTFGQSAMLALVPDRALALAVLTNADAGSAVRRAALNTALKQYLDAELGGGPASMPGTAPSEALSGEQLAEYAGRYALPSDAFVLELVDGGMTISHELLSVPGQVVSSHRAAAALPTTPVVFVAKDRAVVGSIAEPVLSLSFMRRPDGRLGWLVLEGRLFPRND